jgi:hypothetical protein
VRRTMTKGADAERQRIEKTRLVCGPENFFISRAIFPLAYLCAAN